MIVPAALLRSDRGEGLLGRDAWLKVMNLARKNKIEVFEAARKERDPRDLKDGRQGGAELWVKERDPLSLEELFEGVKENPEDRGLWLALDQIQDPHNLGAIFRTAAFFGVRGIITTFERAAPLSATVYDVACGGVDAVPFAIETNLARSLERAKDMGVWTLGASEHADQSVDQIPHDRAWLLLVGNEERGLRRLTLENCDMICQIPPFGHVVTSLNVSVAAAILISKLSSAST